MPISSIAQPVYKTVVLGDGTYATSLTVTIDGSIAPVANNTAAVFDGVTAAVTGAALTNDGSIAASTGFSSGVLAGGNGGIGVDLTLASAQVSNSNIISGGNGGSGYATSGGTGGAGVLLSSSGGALGNLATGTITGGVGGALTGSAGNGGRGSAGNGGNGATLTGAALTNAGSIAAGAGGSAYSVPGSFAGAGGEGVNLSAAATPSVSSGSISGGAGGRGYYQNGAAGGIGLALSAATFTNNGYVSGGAGGATHMSGGLIGGSGGAGASLSGANTTLNNNVTITGGSGGGGDRGGAGGDGATLAGGAALNSYYVIRAGTAGAGASVFGIGGTGVDVSAGQVLNQGSVFGGDGGAAGNGGVGIALHAVSSLTGAGSTTGGNGSPGGVPTTPGSSIDSTGGSGGIALMLASGTTAMLTGGYVNGGNGGTGVYNEGFASFAGGVGGAGVTLTAGASLISAATIFGGGGGDSAGLGIAGFYTSHGGAGADGVLATDATVANSGTIKAGAGGTVSKNFGADSQNVAGIGGVGVELESGTGSNSVLGSIKGGDGGADYTVASTMAGAGGAGVQLTSGAIFTNNGYIHGGGGGGGGNILQIGGAGVSLDGGALINSGQIYGGSGGTGGAGVYVNGGTLTTSGLIVGGDGRPGFGDDAVEFGANAGTLVIDPTARFEGLVAGHSNDVLELGGTAASTLTGLETQFTGFGALQFGSGATWTVDVTRAAVQAGLTPIRGFTATDTLDITDQPLPSGAGYTFSDGVLDLTFQGVPVAALKFDNPNGTHFQLAPDASRNGIDITIVACYLRGTRLLTPRGEVPIENLAVGDEVVTASGTTRTVRWLGSRRLDCARYPNPAAVWPVLIRAGAFAEQSPSRDLWLSPGHSIFIHDVLIRIEDLINDATILAEPRKDVEYWHVELDTHDIVVADGLPAETYLDTGNRCAFVNGGEFLEAHPNFEPKHWRDTCAPLVMQGMALQKARATLLARAAALGYSVTDESDAHIMTASGRIEPWSRDARRLIFVIPAGRTHIELRCRAFIPAHINAASGDQRRLGLCVGRLEMDGIELPLADDLTFNHGWHVCETQSTGPLQRWSRESVPLPDGTRWLSIELAGRSYCWSTSLSRTPLAHCG